MLNQQIGLKQDILNQKNTTFVVIRLRSSVYRTSDSGSEGLGLESQRGHKLIIRRL